MGVYSVNVFVFIPLGVGCGGAGVVAGLYGVNVCVFISYNTFYNWKCVYIKMGFLKLFFPYSAFYD